MPMSSARVASAPADSVVKQKGMLFNLFSVNMIIALRASSPCCASMVSALVDGVNAGSDQRHLLK